MITKRTRNEILYLNTYWSCSFFILSSCGVISVTASVDEETRKVAKEYHGLYVFEPKFRDEMLEIEEKRYELFKKAITEVYKELRKTIPEKELRNMEFGSPLWKQVSAAKKDIERDVNNKAPPSPL